MGKTADYRQLLARMFRLGEAFTIRHPETSLTIAGLYKDLTTVLTKSYGRIIVPRLPKVDPMRLVLQTADLAELCAESMASIDKSIDELRRDDPNLPKALHFRSILSEYLSKEYGYSPKSARQLTI